MKFAIYAKTVKGRIASLFCFLLACPLVQAQPVPPEQVPKLPVIDGKVQAQVFDKQAFVDGLRAKFSRITSYGYTYHLDPPANAYFAECWKEMGDRYYHEIEEPSQNIHEIEVFDGSRTETKRAGRSAVEVRNGDWTSAREPLPSWRSPLEIYAFLNCDAKYLKMRRLAPDSPIWKDLADRIDYGGKAKFLNRDCIILRFRKAFDETKAKEATYDVYFDTATQTPLRWQAYDNQRYMIEEVALVDLQRFAENGDNGPLPFVPRYKHTNYQWAGTCTNQNGVVPYLKGSREDTFDEVAINTLEPGDVLIDKSEVTGIIDGDTHTVTRVQQ
jgi:hypothetical protein